MMSRNLLAVHQTQYPRQLTENDSMPWNNTILATPIGCFVKFDTAACLRYVVIPDLLFCCFFILKL